MIVKYMFAEVNFSFMISIFISNRIKIDKEDFELLLILHT